jgi:hypothetical protein
VKKVVAKNIAVRPFLLLRVPLMKARSGRAANCEAPLTKPLRNIF